MTDLGFVAGTPLPMLVASTPLRIKTLVIKDFRAFGGREPFVVDLDGRNLLVYGENGSGKSSIFHALDEFFSVSLAGWPERRRRFNDLRNRFSGLGIDDGYVEVIFDDGRPAARWSNSEHPVDINGGSDSRVRNGAYKKAILDYRSLLNTNYRFADGEVNLFEVCVEVLLRDYPAVHQGREHPLIDLWRRLNGYLGRKQLRERDISEMSLLAVSFNEGFRNALASVQARVELLLADLGYPDLVLTALTLAGVSYNRARARAARRFSGKQVTPTLTFRGLEVTSPQTFLNEARLSALALAIYFAGRQVCAPTLQADTPRLMVLDDVLIGLDQSNRMPVLRVLEEHFADWQIVLLTHDRVWYEMARGFLADHTGWSALELFEKPRPDGGTIAVSGPALTIVKPKSIDAVAANLKSARTFHGHGEYAAAAVHARIAFEISLKKRCEKNAIPVRFKDDPRELSTNDILIAIEVWLDDPSRTAKKAAVAASISDIKLWRKVVLNQFSHSTPVSLTAAEVLGAIDAVEALHFALKNHLK